MDNWVSRPIGRLIFGHLKIKEGRLVHFTGTKPKINYLYLLKKAIKQMPLGMLARRIRRGLADVISSAFRDD